MTYPEVIKYLESFINYEKIPFYPYKESLKLERIKEFLWIIGNPQESLQCIHVAGSKGKGSSCAFIAYILREAGYSVGLYTSPHLSDFRERIRILSVRRKAQGAKRDFEGMISKNELTNLVEKLKPAVEKYNRNSKYGPLSFFEVYTASAFVYFKKQKVDIAVLETGLGGRLDATNTVNPLVCVITPLSYEHTQKLGNTLREIAIEKAGIIKGHKVTPRLRSGQAKSPLDFARGRQSHPLVVISAPQEKVAMEVIKDRCKDIGANLYEVGKDITYRRNNNEFSVKGVLDEYPNLRIKLMGEHQLINASVAIGAIEALRSNNIDVGKDYIRGGLFNTSWPGRCEVISRDPLVVLDGAQNVASIRVLKATIKESFQYKRLILVLGISDDKDLQGICKELANLADIVILTQANNPRATEPEILARYFNGKVVHKTPGVKEAKAISMRIAKKEDLILVTGSLFVVGEFRNDKI